MGLNCGVSQHTKVRKKRKKNLAKEKGMRQTGRRETKLMVQKPREIVFHEEKTVSLAVEILSKTRTKIHHWIWPDANAGDLEKPLETWLCKYYWNGWGRAHKNHTCDLKANGVFALLHCIESFHVQNGVIENLIKSRNLYLIL